MKIGIVSPGFPPDADGIGDYTWWLSHQLAIQGHQVTVFTASRPERAPPEGVAIVGCGLLGEPFSVARLVSAVTEDANGAAPQLWDWLLFQYNPFSYGRRGFCPDLVLGLRRLRPITRLAIMFHETRVPRWPWRFTLMRCWQTPQLLCLSRLVDVAFAATERWCREVRPFRTRGQCEHIPVGSNLPLCPFTPAEARKRAGLPPAALVLGMFGSAHMSRLIDWAIAAAKTLSANGTHTILLYVGPSAKLPLESGALSIVNCGFLSAEEAALRIRAMDLLLAPFSDGMSTRRTSVMAALQHGVPVVTTKKPWTDAVFEKAPTNDFLMIDTGQADTFAEQTGAWWRARSFQGALPSAELVNFYQQHFSWPMIATAFSRHLELSAGIRRQLSVPRGRS